MKEQDAHYLLNISGHGWELTCEPALTDWLNRLATVMALKPGVNPAYARIRFALLEKTGRPPGAAGETSQAGIAEKQIYDMQDVRIHTSLRGGDTNIDVALNGDGDVTIIDMWNALLPLYLHAIKTGGMPLHAGLATYQGAGILFAAPGNTGKSTTCRRLPPPWKAVCDDEVLVIRDQEKGYLAHPLPTWSDFLWGKESMNTWDVSRSVPVKVIYFLEQSPSDLIVPPDIPAKAAILVAQSAWQVMQRYLERLAGERKWAISRSFFENACIMMKSIPVATLRLSREGRFWELLDDHLRQNAPDKGTHGNPWKPMKTVEEEAIIG